MSTPCVLVDEFNATISSAGALSLSAKLTNLTGQQLGKATFFAILYGGTATYIDISGLAVDHPQTFSSGDQPPPPAPLTGFMFHVMATQPPGSDHFVSPCIVSFFRQP